MRWSAVTMLVHVALLGRPAYAGEEPRKTVDTVGFCTTIKQVEKVLELARRAEKRELARTSRLLSGKTCVAVVCPHDDHLLAARYYLHVLPRLASARTVVIFGVTHKAAREALGDPEQVILLDEYDSWQAPGGPVLVDEALRGCR